MHPPARDDLVMTARRKPRTRELYVFIYRPADRLALGQHLVELAERPELSFSPADAAAVLAELCRQAAVAGRFAAP